MKLPIKFSIVFLCGILCGNFLWSQVELNVAQLAHWTFDSTTTNTSPNQLPYTDWELQECSYSYGYLGERDLYGSLYFYGSKVGSYARLRTPQPSKAVSVSLWFKTSDPAGGSLLSWEKYGYGLRLNQGGRLYGRLFIRENTPYDFVIDGQNLADGSWHHLVLTYDMHQLQVAIDGEIKHQDQQYGPGNSIHYAANDQLYLGGGPAGGSLLPYIGNIDELLIYNRALDTTEIELLYHKAQPGKGPEAERGLLLFLPFINNYDNQSPNHCEAIRVEARGGRFTTACPIASDKDRALFFNGNGDRIEVNQTLQCPESFSLSLSFNTNSGRESFLAGWSEGGYQLTLNPPGYPGKLMATLWSRSDTVQQIITTRNVNDGQCHHAVLSFDGRDMQLYLDGNLVATRRLSSEDISLFYGDGPLLFGGRENLGFQGAIDEVRLYNRPLPHSLIQQLASRTSLDSPLSNPVFRYMLGGSKRNAISPGGALLFRNNEGKNRKVQIYDNRNATVLEEVKLSAGEILIRYYGAEHMIEDLDVKRD